MTTTLERVDDARDDFNTPATTHAWHPGSATQMTACGLRASDLVVSSYMVVPGRFLADDGRHKCEGCRNELVRLDSALASGVADEQGDVVLKQGVERTGDDLYRVP